MGCGGYNSTLLNNSDKTLNKNSKNDYLYNSIKSSLSLVKLINKLKNKILFNYHNILHVTAGCLFKNYDLSIGECLYNILYKISNELNGKIELSEIEYTENLPFLKINFDKISEESKNLLNQLFNFINELYSYRGIIHQIDKETPQLIYLSVEKKENLSKDVIDKINDGLETFKKISEFRESLLNKYLNTAYDLLFSKKKFFLKINQIGNKSFKMGLKDIYDISFLQYETDENNKNKMYKNIETAKKNILKLIMKEKDLEQSLDTDSIIEK